MARRNISIEEKIEKQKEVVAKAKMRPKRGLES
jgi:hypothetical protein